MSYIINIDTATEIAFVSICKNDIVLQVLKNESQKEHGAFVQKGIKQLLQKADLPLGVIDAVAVSAGPGSYTGLRVGMASAKGLCYALNKPLIAINTLQILAKAAINENQNISNILFCAMIDARRMEVFCAIYDASLQIVLQPCAIILDEKSFSNFLQNNQTVFIGSGTKKWQQICNHLNASFSINNEFSNAMAQLSNIYYLNKEFCNLAYTEPFYLKDFQNNI